MFELNFLDDILDFHLFDWDKKFYNFNRDEKDMHPYSVKVTEKECIITHNILGINKNDVKLTKEKLNGKTYITIEGKTKDNTTDKIYSVNSRFVLDEELLDFSKANAKAENGLLYITIPIKKQDKTKESTRIAIL